MNHSNTVLSQLLKFVPDMSLRLLLKRIIQVAHFVRPLVGRSLFA